MEQPRYALQKYSHDCSRQLSTLLQRPDLWRGDTLARTAQDGVASGFAELDAALPGGGWPRGALTELLPHKMGIGELSLLLPALTALEAEAGWIALVAPPWRPHAPAWQAVGTAGPAWPAASGRRYRSKWPVP